ncbi:MAG: DUF4315 family protein [Clostridia bacterium]|nr:DUF4315 family protein [Clostridia bacterium]MBQ9717031.1 DUF4315 family protein [Clostridia bacterium]
MNPKIQKLKSEKEKLLTKKASIEERCNEIDAQVTELENLDIIGTVREMGITPDQLAELLKKMLPLETKTEVTNETEQA